MVSAYQWIHSPSWLAWFNGWWPSDAQSAFTRWPIMQCLCHDDQCVRVFHFDVLLLILQFFFVLVVLIFSSQL